MSSQTIVRYRKNLISASAVVCVLFAAPVFSDVWVFEPSAGIDQRFDDNYTIDTTNPDKVSATRVVGTVGLSRESQNTSFKGLIRVDGLLNQSSQQSSGNELSSNQIFFLDTNIKKTRSEYGIGINLKNDTPSRDIAADITDISSVAADIGASVTQDENVGRQRYLLTPNWRYNLSRRATLAVGLSYTQVEHELPSVRDSLVKQWNLIQSNQNPDNRLPAPANISIDDVGGVFQVDDELDDFKETAFDFGYRYKLSPITTFSISGGYSDYKAHVEPYAGVITDFDDLIPDSRERQILRQPKRVSLSNTTTFRLGYDRALSQTLKIGVQGGIYITDTDESDLLRTNDRTSYSEADLADKLANRVTSKDGWLANVSLEKNANISRYSIRFGVDVLPSDIGAQVESLEVIGDYFRELGPLLDFSFRIRGYEPEVLNAQGDDKFSRRYLSMEPRIIWRFTRAWTAAASYRYRRQKSRGDLSSGDSNALLFSLKYTPPSAIRDAQRNQ